MPSCIRRIFKTATAACSFSRPCLACTRFCGNSLLTAATKGQSFERLWPKRFRTSKSKSSNARIRQKGSRSCRSDGLSSAPSHGSTDAGDWPRILKISPATPWHSCVSHQSGLCSESFVMHDQLLGPTLRPPHRELPSNQRRKGIINVAPLESPCDSANNENALGPVPKKLQTFWIRSYSNSLN